MRRLWAAVVTMFVCVGQAQAFPESSRTMGEVPGLTTANSYNFEGVVALAGCSGSLVRFEDSQDFDQAMILSNGHCVSSLDPGVVLYREPSNRTFEVLSPAAAKLGTVHAVKLLYATMTKTDVSLYLLKETFSEILKKFNTHALTLSRVSPEIGTHIEVISGYWKRGFSCEVESIASVLKEGHWDFENSLRYSRPGCEVMGGTSGSPVVEAGTRTVVAVNNTINEGGARCKVNNPCEVNDDGSVVYKKGYGYAQQTSWLYTCLDDEGQIDVTVEGCLLPKPKK